MLCRPALAGASAVLGGGGDLEIGCAAGEADRVGWRRGVAGRGGEGEAIDEGEGFGQQSREASGLVEPELAQVDGGVGEVAAEGAEGEGAVVEDIAAAEVDEAAVWGQAAQAEL